MGVVPAIRLRLLNESRTNYFTHATSRARVCGKDWQLRSYRRFNFINGRYCRLFVRLHVGLLADLHALQKVGVHLMLEVSTWA